MKVCVAQTKPIKANLEANLQQQLKFVDAAVRMNADVIVFPELSLTGYEPQLAASLAFTLDEERLKQFQRVSDEHTIIIGTSMPLLTSNGVCIALLFFHPQAAKQVYYKHYLHTDEEPFFVPGNNDDVLIHGTRIGVAICYEISVPEHVQDVCKNGANMYVASVAKTAQGTKQAYNTLSAVAAKYGMPVLMSNSVGYCDNFYSAGSSAIWDDEGRLIAQLNEEEGLLVFDNNSKQTEIKIL